MKNLNLDTLYTLCCSIDALNLDQQTREAIESCSIEPLADFRSLGVKTADTTYVLLSPNRVQLFTPFQNTLETYPLSQLPYLMGAGDLEGRH